MKKNALNLFFYNEWNHFNAYSLDTLIFLPLSLTTKVKSTFCMSLLAGLEVISKYNSPPSCWGVIIAHQKFNFGPFFV